VRLRFKSFPQGTLGEKKANVSTFFHSLLHALSALCLKGYADVDGFFTKRFYLGGAQSWPCGLLCCSAHSILVEEMSGIRVSRFLIRHIPHQRLSRCDAHSGVISFGSAPGAAFETILSPHRSSYD